VTALARRAEGICADGAAAGASRRSRWPSSPRSWTRLQESVTRWRGSRSPPP